jgi:hypothetical protein
MPITFPCSVCGDSLATPDELAGKLISCPTCNNRIGVPVPALESLAVQALEEPLVPRPVADAVSRPFWRDPVVLIGAAVPTLILTAFIAYLVGVNVGSKRMPTDQMNVNTASPDPVAPHARAAHFKHPYEVIEEIHNPPHPSPVVKGHRMIDVRLSGKVAEEVLREISLDVKARNSEPFFYTSISFYLPGKGKGMGPSNRNAWATAYFSGDAWGVQIAGLSIKDEYWLRTHALILPDRALDICIWLIDDGFGSQQIVFYRLADEWRWHFREPHEEKQRHIMLKELPDNEGRCFQPTGSTVRYVVFPNGDLKLYTGEGMLIHHTSQQSPPPPIRRTTHPSAKIR